MVTENIAKKSEQAIDNKQDEIQSPWKLVWKRLKRNKLAMLSIFILATLVLLAVFAPLVTPYERDQLDFTAIKQPPSSVHILGTDELGRDIYTRLLFGGRISLSVGVVAMIIDTILGVIIGGIAGYYGGKIDRFLMILTDIVLCFPFLIICITVVSILGPSIFNVMIVLGLLGWTGLARIIRGQILSLREQEFMEAARALGISDFKQIVRHLLPNTMSSVIVSGTLAIAGAILTESGLSFLGLGVSPPTPTWGNMLQSAQKLYVIKNQPWLWLPPGLAIFITVISLNVLGDGLRDALDPKLKR